MKGPTDPSFVNVDLLLRYFLNLSNNIDTPQMIASYLDIKLLQSGECLLDQWEPSGGKNVWLTLTPLFHIWILHVDVCIYIYM